MEKLKCDIFIEKKETFIFYSFLYLVYVSKKI